jgi:hypothetical protein
MKFVKRSNILPHRPLATNLSYEIDGKIVTDSSASIQIPAGTTAQRVETYREGQMRYNTDANAMEAYINGAWQFLRTVTQANITFQTLGTGNYADTIFGPLSYPVDPVKTANVFVYVENVPQMPTINYNLVNDPTADKATTSTTLVDALTVDLEDLYNLKTGMGVTGDAGLRLGTTIASISTNSNKITLSTSTVAEIVSATNLTFVFDTGTYVTFTSAPPSKPVYTIEGFDGYFPPFPQ